MRIEQQSLGKQPCSWRRELRVAVVAVTAYLAILAVFAYYGGRDRPESAGSASERLQPVTTPLPDATTRRTVYVPIYSSLYLGLDIKRNLVQLAATLSIRNTSPRYPIVVESVRYYDSAGRLVRDHVSQPAELGALASVEFVVKEADQTGGPGANFLVRWAGPSASDEPLIEAVMVGRAGNAGISFLSASRTITNVEE